MKNWVCVYSSRFQPSAEMIKGILIHNDINSVVVNKQDAAYKFGEYEVYVHMNDEIRARVLLDDNQQTSLS